MALESKQLNELILQSLEHERGGERIYETALECALHEDLKKEWEEYLDQTRNHVKVLEGVCGVLGLDPEQKTPGRAIVKGLGEALLSAIEQAQSGGDPNAAQLVACECVTLAETKDHLDWELIAQAAKKLGGENGRALKDAVAAVEDQEDEHIYHTKGWCRELWLDALGVRAVLPPPEERKHVKTAIGAARAEQARDTMR
jgi:ferritin-like metal-binding protein YciE